MAGENGAGRARERDQGETLASILARSDDLAREVEQALARLDELATRFEADDEALAAEPAHEPDEPVDDTLDGAVEEPADVRIEAEGSAAEPPAEPEPIDPRAVVEVGEAEPDGDPWRRMTEKILLASRTTNGGSSVDRDIVILQEATRRRLSDER